MQHKKSAHRAMAAIGLSITSLAATAAPPSGDTAEGYLFRQILGSAFPNSYGIVAEGYLQAGVAHNDNSTSASRAGGNSNFPVVPGDEGFKLDDLKIIISKPIATNIVPRITPLPGPVPSEVSFGFEANIMYGRNGQPAAMFGFDQHWGVNEPGASDPAKAAANRQNFVAVPQLFAQAYFPIGQGVALTVGRFGSGVGYEIPPQLRVGPNVFYSRSYAFLSQPDQLAGALLSANVMRGAAGLMAIEIGSVTGWQNLQDNNDSRSVTGAVRWRSPDMRTAINYAFITGKEQNAPGEHVQAPVATIISPRGQRRQHHSISASRDFGNGWNAAVELLYGKQEGDGLPDTISIVTGPGFAGARYRGQNAIVSYRTSPSLRYSVRAEHFSNPNGFALTALTTVPATLNAVTVGTQYDLNKFVAFRPEVRYDWQPGHASAKVFGNGTATRQLTLSADMLIRF